MDPRALIAKLRQLGSFIASLVPPLGRAVDRARAWISDHLGRVAWIARMKQRIGAWRSGPRARALAEAISAFYWVDYSKKRATWAALPEEWTRALRLELVAGLALALLAPLALIASLDGTTAAWWSLALWPLALALAWGGLLSGAAAAPRAVLVAVTVLFLWFGFGVVALGPGRTWAAALLPAIALLAVAIADARPDVEAGRAPAAITGAAAGLTAALLLPISRGLGPWKAAVGLALGLATGLAVHRAARRRRQEVPRAKALLGACVLVWLAALSLEGGFAPVAGTLRELVDQLAGYTWPIWYFAGVGIIFAALGATDTVAGLCRAFTPGRWLVAATGLFLLAGTALLFSPVVVDAPGVAWPRPVVEAAIVLYRAGRSIWNDLEKASTAAIARWVFAAELCAYGVLLARRRLDDGRAAVILYQTLLGWLLASEYTGQLHGFAHAGPRSALKLAFFALSALWILQSFAQKVAFADSPRWPARARIGLAGGALVLVLLQLHVRAAVHDTRVADEIGLSMFRGVVDVGLPVAAYVWSTRVTALPVAGWRLLAALVLGGVAGLPLIMLDKLALSGWDLSAFSALAAQRTAWLLSGDLAALESGGVLPAGWVIARGALAMLALAAFARGLGRVRREPAAMLVLAAAFGAGQASISHMRLDLPLLPPKLMVLLWPERIPLELDAHVLAMGLAYVLPAVVLALVAAGRGWLRLAAAFALALSAHLAIALPWPAEEERLRASGLLATAAAAGLLAALLLVLAARPRLVPEEAPHGRWRLAGPALAAAAVLVFAGARQLASSRMIPRAVEGLGALSLPEAWRAIPPAPDALAAFMRASDGPLPSMIFVSRDPSPPDRALLARKLEEASRVLPGFAPMPPSHEGPRIPGALVASYAFELRLADGNAVPLIAMTAVAGDGAGGSLIFSLAGALGPYLEQRWDLARMIRSGGFVGRVGPGPLVEPVEGRAGL